MVKFVNDSNDWQFGITGGDGEDSVCQDPRWLRQLSNGCTTVSFIGPLAGGTVMERARSRGYSFDQGHWFRARMHPTGPGPWKVVRLWAGRDAGTD